MYLPITKTHIESVPMILPGDYQSCSLNKQIHEKNGRSFVGLDSM